MIDDKFSLKNFVAELRKDKANLETVIRLMAILQRFGLFALLVIIAALYTHFVKGKHQAHTLEIVSGLAVVFLVGLVACIAKINLEKKRKVGRQLGQFTLSILTFTLFTFGVWKTIGFLSNEAVPGTFSVATLLIKICSTGLAIAVSLVSLAGVRYVGRLRLDTNSDKK